MAENTSTVRNVDAEFVVLGSMMIENKVIDRIADRLAADDFAEALHGRIFSAILTEAGQGRAANPVTLQPYLKDDPALNELGGVSYLLEMTKQPGLLFGLDTCADQVRDMAKRRRLIEGLNEAAAMAADMSVANEDVIGVADNAISTATDQQGDGVVQISASDAFEEMLHEYEQPKGAGVRCGAIRAFDEAIGPIRPHDLVIGAGRPGMGKTIFALTYAIRAAQNGHGVLFVSREMKRVDLMQRAAADLCFNGQWGVAYDDICEGDFKSGEDRSRVYGVLRTMRDLPLILIDAGHMSIGRLNMIVRRQKRRFAAKGHTLELIVVDYLQLLSPDRPVDNETANVSAVSVGLKSIAKTHDLGVLALAQLNRSVESRENKRPMISDLRQSGQIEQDADTIVFLYRDEYYLRKAMPPETDPQHAAMRAALDEVTGKIELITAKRRKGEERTTYAAFWGKFQTIRDQ